MNLLEKSPHEWKVFYSVFKSQVLWSDALENYIHSCSIYIDDVYTKILREILRMDMAKQLIAELTKKYENTPDMGKLVMANFEILLESSDRPKVKEFVEDCINGELKVDLSVISLCKIFACETKKIRIL